MELTVEQLREKIYLFNLPRQRRDWAFGLRVGAQREARRQRFISQAWMYGSPALIRLAVAANKGVTNGTHQSAVASKD